MIAIGILLIVLSLCGCAFGLDFYLDGKDSF